LSRAGVMRRSAILALTAAAAFLAVDSILCTGLLGRARCGEDGFLWGVMRSFTILSLMGFVLASAIALAALRSGDEYWAGGLLMVTLLLLGTAVLAVVYQRGQSRAGWLGFLVFGGAYLVLSIGQWPSEAVSAKLPTTRFLNYAHARV